MMREVGRSGCRNLGGVRNGKVGPGKILLGREGAKRLTV